MSFYYRNEHGEINQVKSVGFERQVKRPGNFVQVHNTGWSRIREARLTGREVSVLCTLMEHLSFKNTVAAETTAIAELCGMTPQNVSTAIRTLLQKKIFADTGYRIGKTRVLLLLHDVGSKGKLQTIPTPAEIKEEILQARAKAGTTVGAV